MGLSGSLSNGAGTMVEFLVYFAYIRCNLFPRENKLNENCWRRLLFRMFGSDQNTGSLYKEANLKDKTHHSITSSALQYQFLPFFFFLEAGFSICVEVSGVICCRSTSFG